ncbi:hypothetical protein BH09VER1_BH09VER1_03690 [soil metagenome]
MARGVPRREVGFTLIEMLVSMVILILLMGVIFSVINVTGKAWKSSSGKIEAFQASRAAFESMTRKIGQATLNTYYDYFDTNGNSAVSATYSGAPSYYGRQSELHFKAGKSCITNQITQAVFFQTPAGETGKTYEALNELLNACGYFIQFGSDASTNSLSGRPAFLDGEGIPLRYRYRLMELSVPSENLKIYSGTSDPKAWYTAPLAQTPPSARVLAENVVALVILPKKADWEEKKDDLAGLPRISPDYEYDTRTAWSGTSQPIAMNQLPPMVKVVMVAIDETSAKRWQSDLTTPPSLGLPSNIFTQPSQLEADLKTLQSKLQAKNLNYRVFQTEIPLRTSRWTQQ